MRAARDRMPWLWNREEGSGVREPVSAGHRGQTRRVADHRRTASQPAAAANDRRRWQARLDRRHPRRGRQTPHRLPVLRRGSGKSRRAWLRVGAHGEHGRPQPLRVLASSRTPRLRPGQARSHAPGHQHGRDLAPFPPLRGLPLPPGLAHARIRAAVERHASHPAVRADHGAAEPRCHPGPATTTLTSEAAPAQRRQGCEIRGCEIRRVSQPRPTGDANP
jgi:hypothetical protein